MKKEYMPKNLAMHQKGYDIMDKEARDLFHGLIVIKEEVKEDKIINHPQYGDIIVTIGNYLLTSRKGEKIGITPTDFEAQYKELNVETDPID